MKRKYLLVKTDFVVTTIITTTPLVNYLIIQTVVDVNLLQLNHLNISRIA